MRSAYRLRFAPKTVRQNRKGVRQGLEQVSDRIGIRNTLEATPFSHHFLNQPTGVIGSIGGIVPNANRGQSNPGDARQGGGELGNFTATRIKIVSTVGAQGARPPNQAARASLVREQWLAFRQGCRRHRIQVPHLAA